MLLDSQLQIYMLLYETGGNYSLLKFNSLVTQRNSTISLKISHLATFCKNLLYVLLCLLNLLEYYLVYHFLYIAFIDRALQNQFIKLFTILLVTAFSNLRLVILFLGGGINSRWFSFFLEAILNTIQMKIPGAKLQKLGFDYMYVESIGRKKNS